MSIIFAHENELLIERFKSNYLSMIFFVLEIEIPLLMLWIELLFYIIKAMKKRVKIRIHLGWKILD